MVIIGCGVGGNGGCGGCGGCGGMYAGTQPGVGGGLSLQGCLEPRFLSEIVRVSSLDGK